MAKAVSVETMRKSDAYTIEHLVPSKELMRRAGEAIFENMPKLEPVGIICGKGNNAGDGFVVAALLKESGIDCEIILLFDSFSEDGRYFYDACIRKNVPAYKYNEDMDFKKYGTIVDCILGTGFSGAVRPPLKDVIEKINASGAFVVSADINSGLNGDTGMGETFVKSDLTVSIGDYKPAHFIGLSKAAMKAKMNCDIGIKIIGDYIEFEEE